MRVARPERTVSPSVLGGAIEADGRIANDTLCHRAPTLHRRARAPDWLGAEDGVRAYGEEVLWGGQIFNHYGHFLCESVSRLWPLLSEGEHEGLPVVFVPEPGRERSSEPPFVREWLDAFGVCRVELPDRGTVRFARMLVPEPAWRINACVAPEIRDIHLRARAGMDLRPSRPQEGVLWLSRSELGRYRSAYDERLLERLLTDHLTIVNPETMTLGEQVAAFEESRGVAGVIGSAFNTMLMTARPPDCLYVCPPSDKPSFPAQHRFIEGRADFAKGLAIVASTRHARERGAAFPFGFRLLVPETLRALGATVLPELLDDPRIAAFAEPERHWSRTHVRSGSDIDAAIARVLLDPDSIEARLALAELFETEGLGRCALEQLVAVADLTDDHGDLPLRAARLLGGEERLEEGLDGGR